MSENDAEHTEQTEQTDRPGEVSDDQLPEDLQPTDDNPLARHPGETGDDADAIGEDREGDPETAPLTEEDADYGSGESSTDSGGPV